MGPSGDGGSRTPILLYCTCPRLGGQGRHQPSQGPNLKKHPCSQKIKGQTNNQHNKTTANGTSAFTAQQKGAAV